MRILITNDDGIFAAGIRRLAAEASKYGEVYVAAPSEQQSAKSQSITFLRPVAIRETGVCGATEAYEVEGTPADCVKWAIPHFRELGIEFDYVFTGINLGSNVGLAAYYSGTISAAREGALNGVRSIAFSVATHDASEFDYICNLIPQLMEMSSSLSISTILSVNAPNLPAWETKGVRIAEVAPWEYGDKYAFRKVQDGLYQMEQVPSGDMASAAREVRWFDAPDAAADQVLGMAAEREKALRYDYDCLHHGYAAITPLISHTSDTVALNRLNGLFPQAKPVTLLVDVQERNVTGLSGREQFADNITRFARCISRLDMPSIITEIYGLGDTLPAIRECAPKSEMVVRRELGTGGSYDFARKIDEAQAKSVMIAGAETHMSVLRTALDLREAGYEVTVIEDCCAARGGHDHKIAIETMRDVGCIITTMRAAVMQLVYRLNRPAAEAISAILG